MPSQTAEELIQEAKAVLDRCDRSGTFNRESEARVSQLLKMAELSRAGEIDSSNVFTPKSVRQLFQQTQMQITERTVDPAAIEFFAGKRRSRMNEGGTISLSGGRIEEIATGSRINGRPIGAIAELRDLSAMLPEQRSYRGLNTSTSDDAAGFTIPIGYIPQVIHAMKRTDQILEACNWNLAATADGRPINIPSLTDVETSAVPIAEAAAQTFQNVTFGTLQFNSATTWTSKVIKASVQLDQDAVPALMGTLADAFRIRFARGFGKAVVDVVLADATVGATAASSSAITQKDLLELMKSLDAAYGSADSSGWCMNWDTLMYVFENVITTSSAGDALFHARKDANGHYLLFEKPVYISNSLDDIGAGNKPVLFGDFSRLIIRNVPGEAVIRRYDELFMANLQKGYEMLIRADAQVLHAGGADDQPIKALSCGS